MNVLNEAIIIDFWCWCVMERAWFSGSGIIITTFSSFPFPIISALLWILWMKRFLQAFLSHVSSCLRHKYLRNFFNGI
jgi:hypothetical protein